MSKENSSKYFTYTAQRGPFLTIIALFAFLTLIEGGAAVLLIAVLVKETWLMLLLHVLSVGSIVWAFVFFLSPLWTKHCLTPTQLILHYGWGFKLAIPRESIVKALPVRKELGLLQPLRRSYEDDKARLTVSFSEVGQVLLNLDPPSQWSFRKTKGPVNWVILNFDQREEFLNEISVVAIQQ